MLAKRRVHTVKFTHKSSRKYRLRYSDRKGFPFGSVVKSPPANAGDADSVPGSGRSPGGGNGNMLQCSCLENPMDRGTWQAAVHRVTKSWTQLSD